MDWLKVKSKLEKEWKDKALKDIKEELSRMCESTRSIVQDQILLSVFLYRAFEEIEKLKK